MTQTPSLPYMLDGIQPGDTIYTTIMHVSKSGMTRDIKITLIRNNNPLDISYAVADLLDYKIKNNGVRIRGAGMDMGFALIYDLSRRLFPSGFGLPCDNCTIRPIIPTDADTNCEATVNEAGSHKFYGRNGDESGWDTDGGYALNHRWL